MFVDLENELLVVPDGNGNYKYFKLFDDNLWHQVPAPENT